MRPYGIDGCALLKALIIHAIQRVKESIKGCDKCANLLRIHSRDGDISVDIIDVVDGVLSRHAIAASFVVAAEELVNSAVACVLELAQHDVAASHGSRTKTDSNPVAHFTLSVPSSGIHILNR